MGTLTVEGLTKFFGAEKIFADVSFRAEKGEHIGLVGANGTGKTTLLRCLLGLESFDGGSVKFGDADSTGYMEQQEEFSAGSLYDELMRAFDDVTALGEKKRALENAIADAADKTRLDDYGRIAARFEELGGYEIDSRIRRAAFGLGFDESDLQKDARAFSGGQKTRISLAKALLREPDFLFLDEPTNHLDIAMTEWLEDFLASYRGGLIVISHDRFFLDRVTTRIFEMANKTVTAYNGNYSRFVKIRDERRAALSAAYDKQQDYIKKTEEYIRRYKAGIKSKQARGRQSLLDRLERIEPPKEDAAFRGFMFQKPPECAANVAELDDVCVSLGGREILSGVGFLIRKGDGAAIIGANGAGKTTLLRVLVGEITDFKGEVKIGSRVKIGYFSQRHEGLDERNSVLDEITFEYGMAEETARNYLGAFLFRGDDVYKKVGDLSGGEKSRLAFLKLMLDGANFLVLDEPTNHLDIQSKEAVEDALAAFAGTFLVVSHDRYFLDRLATRTFELEGGKLVGYDGNYSYYRQKKAERLAASAKISAPTAKERGGKNFAARNEKDAAKKTTAPLALSAEKRDLLIARAEAEIAMAEAELKGLEHEMNLYEVQLDPEKSRRIAELYAAKEKEIADRYEKWERLAFDNLPDG